MYGHNAWIVHPEKPRVDTRWQPQATRPEVLQPAGYTQAAPKFDAGGRRDASLDHLRFMPYAQFRKPNQIFTPVEAEVLPMPDRTMSIPRMGYNSRFYYRK